MAEGTVFDGSVLEEAVDALARGEVVAFPTDTVVGIGVSVEAASSPHLLYEVKRRDEGKPIAWLVDGVRDLERYGAEVPEAAYELARRYWPGPLTIIVRASDAVSSAFCGGDGTIGLRMPDSADALALIRAVGCPLATTSANIAGDPAPRVLSELDPRIVEGVACVFEAPREGGVEQDGGSASGLASTIVDCSRPGLRVIREGAVTMADIQEVEKLVAEKGGVEAGEGVVCEELSFASSDGASNIYVRWWLPADEARVRGVVQLIHGMTEHIGRYDRFARHLVEQGFAVCGHDHIGHGCSVASPDDLGCLPPKDGKRIMIADAHHVRKLAAERFGDIPHFILGHSMGSFVLRAYLARHGSDLAGAIVCGTGHQALALSKAGNALANFLSAIRGPRSTSSLIHNMVIGAYAKAIPNAKTPHDWLSTDPAVPEAYAADPLCGYQFSVGGYAALTSLTAEVVTAECAAGVPKDVPMLYIAGALDPVGDCGKGVRAAAEFVKSAGVADVETIIYEGMRHEILGEIGKERVYDDVTRWINDRMVR